MPALSERIKSEAKRLGFSLAGITTPDPPEHFGFYLDWLARGFHGEMGYLASEAARTRRSDPRRILPDCESILVLAFPYDAAIFENSPPGTPRGKIASYAWGLDYHEIIRSRLEALVGFIETEIGAPVPNRYYTDTGPVLERDFAQRAGLGWIGKNTCLINPGQGSYFFLAEILLGCKLVPDPAFRTDHCGTCTRCIDACPTDCILPDRTLDAARCISYLTIELKGPVPEPLRAQIGEWVFGCDICQQVCPWNIRFAPERGEPGLESDPSFGQPALIDALALDAGAFNRKFKGRPVKRAKRRGYLRSVAIALGNTRSPDAVPALGKALLEDPEPLVRGHAAWALGRIGGPPAAAALKTAARNEMDPAVMAEINAAQSRLEGSGAQDQRSSDQP
ncbi:MAG TPA: tRNA epoxyqueuosine(34) reductase QueG [Anaerolineales bacterium]|nr:tRNA epoxyqueuosine(34) reductase QueG [Anaerolineales bacterium]